MESSAMHWKDEMDKVLATFNRETRASLKNIRMTLKREGLSLNTKFRQYFLEVSTNRIKESYDQFVSESMFEDEVNHAEVNVSKSQSVDNPVFSSVTKQQSASGNSKQMYQPIEIYDSSDEEIIHTKSETDIVTTNGRTGTTMNGLAGGSTTFIQIYDSNADAIPNVSSARVSHAVLNQIGANPSNDCEYRSNMPDVQGTNGKNDHGENDNSAHVNDKKDIKQKVPKVDEDIPIVLVEVNRKFNISVAKIPDVGTNTVNGELKKIDKTKKNNSFLSNNSNGSLTKKMPKRSSIDSIGKRSTTKFKPAQKSSGKISPAKRSNGRKLVKCPLCAHVLSDKHLSRHMRTHTGEKRYGCDRCGRRFTNAINLKGHATVHTDDFSFHCAICFRGFSLRIEKEAHEKECNVRRYECHLCKKSVTWNISALKEHMRKHTGEKPFRCEICMTRFTQNRSLKHHLDTIHNRSNQ